MGVGSLSLLQGIFPTQGSNPGLHTLLMDSLQTEPQGKMCVYIYTSIDTLLYKNLMVTTKQKSVIDIHTKE